ncbi:MAG: metallophosphoesterase [Candidatus Shapirobacteria bacterium]
MKIRGLNWRIAVVFVLVLVLILAGWWLSNCPLTPVNPVVKVEEPEPTEIAKLKLGVMADVHLDWKSLKQGLEIAKGRGEKLVIIDGDLTSVGQETEIAAAKKVLDESGIEYMAVPGNHDLWMSDKIKVDLWQKYFGSKYQTTKEGKVKLILINNAGVRGLGEIQTEWLNKELEECFVWRCLAIMHMPIKHKLSEHVMGEDSKTVTAEANELWEKLISSGVREIITGHLHYSSSYEIDGIRTYVVGAISQSRNNQTPRYTEFEVGKEQVTSQVVILEEEE